ncbi:hypothetical protein [Roseiterribacter gracilis]|uniref:Uncharacterized protein n=1 Tax=Roseiterribacter gracilis TaxID=2812848 RepID=A0A8S8X9Z1_9PROT|nr:hypothetical protein TMPK1_30650 [Rhodospirillales bacterium TMPK1]
MIEVETQADRDVVLRERARLAEAGAERRANPSELRFLDKIRDRALAEGDEFAMTDEQRSNYARIVRDVLDRTGWRPTRR